jgi:pSer/pThr/pTyr-binding forkhead associated (FHA) protein
LRKTNDVFKEEASVKCLLRLFEVRKGQSIIELSKDSTLAGRDPEECDVVLDPLDTLASRHHFAIRRDGENHFLRDLSKNGTWVNGERVKKSGRRLYHGDIIEAGNAEVTFFLVEETKTAEQLLEEGKKNELVEPSYSIQCYSLAHRQCPTNIEYASSLLNVLEQEGRNEELITGGNYFDPEEMMGLVGDARVAVPIANAFVKIGDFARAMEVIEQAGGENADSRLGAIVEDIKRQAGQVILTTATKRALEIPVFQRGRLKIYIEERADFADLRYVERYYRYLQQRIDHLFGESPKGDIVFHITVRDHLFAQSLPNQSIILGYYSPESKRIFIRPRRWMARGTEEHDFHTVLMHEYVHFLVHDICGGMWLPKWYNEGLAHLLSGSKKPQECKVLKSLRDKCTCIPVFSDAVFSPVHGDLWIAHLQSYAILLFLARKLGQEKLISVLTEMEDCGGDFQRSFESTLGMSLQELDSKWWSILEEV